MNLTRIISPARAITPSITKTLNRERTSKSESMIEDKEKDTRNRIKNVMISSKRSVIRSHSENIRKAKDRRSQIVSTNSVENEMGLEEQNTEK